MSRLKKQERQKQLQEKLNITPFLTDEELATHFGVSVPTIRLDRLELGFLNCVNAFASWLQVNHMKR